MGGEKAVITYEQVKPGVLDLQHTMVPDVFRGKGVAAVLAKEAFDFVASNNLKTRVSCTYLVAYLDKEPNQKYKKFVVS